MNFTKSFQVSVTPVFLFIYFILFFFYQNVLRICEEGDWHSILAKKYLVWFSGDRTTAPSLLVRALYRRDHRAVQKFS